MGLKGNGSIPAVFSERLRLAKKVGMQTVLCKGWHHHGLSAVAHMGYVDAIVAHIRDIARLIKSPQIKKNARRKNRLHSA